MKWQWPYSGFGEIAPQSTPAAGQAAVSYSLRYPGQVDDGNGLFYNWNRFYDPRVGRYTSADPIGLDGGWNRFGYVGADPLQDFDPDGLSPKKKYSWGNYMTNCGKCAYYTDIYKDATHSCQTMAVNSCQTMDSTIRYLDFYKAASPANAITKCTNLSLPTDFFEKQMKSCNSCIWGANKRGF